MNSRHTGSAQGVVLVVDDMPDNVFLLSRILLSKGYRIHRANSGRDALVIAQTDLPDLILLDVCMPELTGYQVCQMLKAEDRTQDIPVIFISALDSTEEIVKAFNVGGVDYITKPFRPAEVQARVSLHLTLRRLQQQLQEQNALLQQENHDRLAAEAALQAANLELQRLANLDGLTQLANRRCFDACLEREWRRLAREQQPLSLLLCDIDFFKYYNDTYGHLLGDECLRQVASALEQAAKRPGDMVARYGGEEFAMILPNTPLPGAVQVAENVRAKLQDLALFHETSQVSPCVTLSLGVATIIPMPTTSPTVLIAGADRALYQAKKEGRDRIVTVFLESSPLE
jgi:diguanylate cyclase (GGDEF)-like protein